MDHTVDLAAYLKRIGIERPAAADAAALAALHEAHATTVPFENVDIQLGLPIRLDLPSLEAKIVGRRRGGYCFEQNGLFGAVLQGLGYGVVPLAARVRASGVAMPPRTHEILSVEAEGSRWLCDVGFGGDGPYRPIPLGEGESEQYGDRYRLREEGGELWLAVARSGAWEELYSFTLEPAYPMDFEVANWFTSTHPRSHFVTKLTAQRLLPKGERRVLRNRDYTVRCEGKETKRELRSADELLGVLEADFGIVLPEGTRLRNPVFDSG